MHPLLQGEGWRCGAVFVLLGRFWVHVHSSQGQEGLRLAQEHCRTLLSLREQFCRGNACPQQVVGFQVCHEGVSSSHLPSRYLAAAGCVKSEGNHCRFGANSPGSSPVQPRGPGRVTSSLATYISPTLQQRPRHPLRMAVADSRRMVFRGLALHALTLPPGVGRLSG